MAQSDRKPWGASSPIEQVIDLAAHREGQRRAEVKARQRKYGRRYYIIQRDRAEWKAEMHKHAVSNQLLLIGRHFTRQELQVLWFLIENQDSANRRMTQAEIRRGTSIPPSKMPKITRRLAASGFIVNLGTDSAPDLAVNPQAPYWNVELLDDMRKAHGNT